MNKRLKKLIQKICTNRDRYSVPLTDNDKIQTLLNKLRPISCSKKLIHLGPKGDGGYLIPDDLEGIKACFSPGVGMISQFEKECAQRGMEVFLADNSVEKAAESDELFHFTKKFLGITSNSNFMTLDHWVTSSLPKSQDDLLLQIDIEGFEYEVFLGVSDELLKRFRIIVVEFHDLDQLWNKPYFDLISHMFDKLLQTHSCVHNHPNNYRKSIKKGDIEIPLVTELTFLRNDRIENASFTTTFPHPLDCDNNPKKPPLHLPKCWYS